MTQATLSQPSIAAGPALGLFILQSAMLVAGLAALTGQLGGAFVFGIVYLFSTALFGSGIFLPTLLAFKGRTTRFSIAFGIAGALAGFVPTLILFGGFSMLVGASPSEIWPNTLWFALFNGVIGLVSGLLTRFWLRERLYKSVFDGKALAEIYS